MEATLGNIEQPDNNANTKAVPSNDWKTMKKITGRYILNNFIKPKDIYLEGSNYDTGDDRTFVNCNIDKKVENDIFDRPQYPFYYLCHATKEKYEKLIKETKYFKASKYNHDNEFRDCFFSWWHVYPYSSPFFDLTEKKKDEFTMEVRKMKTEILKPFRDNITDAEKKEVCECLVTSGVFKLKLFPHLTHNFVYSIQELLVAYKRTMNCEKLSFKKFGTFNYLNPDNSSVYLREIMYAIIICPADLEEFSDLDEADDVEDILLFDKHHPENVPWTWIPYSTSAGKATKERHWDYVGFAFYLTKDKHLVPERNPTSIPYLDGNLSDLLRDINVC